jgi:hypothetical protein
LREHCGFFYAEEKREAVAAIEAAVLPLIEQTQLAA